MQILQFRVFHGITFEFTVQDGNKDSFIIVVFPLISGSDSFEFKSSAPDIGETCISSFTFFNIYLICHQVWQA